MMARMQYLQRPTIDAGAMVKGALEWIALPKRHSCQTVQTKPYASVAILAEVSV